MKIIAESAFNHNGSLEYLKELANAAKNSGANFFTVQVMHVESFCTTNYVKYDLYKNTEFTKEQWFDVFDYCKAIKLSLIPCILEETSLNWCLEYGFELLKIHATDITNFPLLNKISKAENVKVILETQCATLFEVKYAISILGREKIEALFTGYSNYPSEVEELNLNVLDAFKRDFGLPLGFADHSLDTKEIPLMLLAKGCTYLEKHITLTRNNRNFDWQVSLYPYEFAAMVATIKHYTQALGTGVKHPTKNEKPYRTIMYKKVVDGETTLKRSNEGRYWLDKEIEALDRNNVVVALIARLKSQRLTQKVLRPFLENELIIDLYNRLSTSNKFKTTLATSTLPEDDKLAELFIDKKLPCYRGEPISVIDRMLDLAFEQKAGAIFRVTGDNPFTDPVIMDEMISLYLEHDLDYVKVNNAPFGFGAELFSTKYLWRLYQQLETTEFSEYLTWYVLNDDSARMGSIDMVSDSSYQLVNLSVDLQEDLDRCKLLLKNIGKTNFTSITTKDVFSNLSQLDSVDGSKEIKLPGGTKIQMLEYLNQFNKKNYIIRKKHIV